MQETRRTQTMELTARVEALLRAAQIEVAQCHGARHALVDAARELETHLGAVDRDTAEGRLDDSLRVAVKRYVNRCGETVRNLAGAAQMQLFQAQGKVLAFQRAASEAKRLSGEAQTPAPAGTSASDWVDDAASNSITGRSRTAAPRTAGEHPGDPLAPRRQEAQIQQASTRTARPRKKASPAKPKARRRATDAVDA